jgi:hypothetical protein
MNECRLMDKLHKFVVFCDVKEEEEEEKTNM